MKCVISTSGSGAGVWGSENAVRTPGARARVWVGTSGESRGTEAGPGGGRLGATVLGLGGSVCAAAAGTAELCGGGGFEGGARLEKLPAIPRPFVAEGGRGQKHKYGVKLTSLSPNPALN